MNTHDTFEDRLLTQLKHAVAERPHRRRGRMLAVGAGLGLTAMLGFGIPTLLSGTAAAYEITEHGDTFKIEIRELTDPEELEAALAEHGLKSDVTYLPDGKDCAPGRFQGVSGDSGLRSFLVGQSGTRPSVFGIELEDFDTDNTLVIELGRMYPGDLRSEQNRVSGVGVTAGEVAECELVDAPTGD